MCYGNRLITLTGEVVLLEHNICYFMLLCGCAWFNQLHPRKLETSTKGTMVAIYAMKTKIAPPNKFYDAGNGSLHNLQICRMPYSEKYL